MESNLIPVGIDEETLRELKWLSDYMRVPPSEALRQAIATQAYIQQVLNEKGEVLVRKEGELRRVTFKPIAQAQHSTTSS
jgi:hypothetical protein